jgi:hypothetical protein
MSSTERATRADSVPAPIQPVTRAVRQGSDQISTQSATFLKTALGSQPEVRPEVVARARALAADPGYPSASIMKSVAGQILAAPDLSDDES